MKTKEKKKEKDKRKQRNMKKISRTSGFLFLLLLTQLFNFCTPTISRETADKYMTYEGEHDRVDVLLQFSMDEDSADSDRASSADRTIEVKRGLLFNPDGKAFKAFYQDRIMALKLTLLYDDDTVAFGHLTYFVEPVRFREVRMLYGPANLSCTFISEEGDESEKMLPGSPLILPDGFVSAEISCGTDAISMYSELTE